MPITPEASAEMPPMPDMGMPAMNEFPVPLSALAMPDDTEQMQTPNQGDTVSVQVDATVNRIEGEMAFITPTAVNGKPLEEETAESPQQEADELRNEAAGMSEM